MRFEVGDGVGLRIRVYDVRAEALIADAELRLGGVHGGWTLDGEQFFYWLNVGVEGRGHRSRWAGGVAGSSSRSTYYDALRELLLAPLRTR